MENLTFKNRFQELHVFITKQFDNVPTTSFSLNLSAHETSDVQKLNFFPPHIT